MKKQLFYILTIFSLTLFACGTVYKQVTVQKIGGFKVDGLSFDGIKAKVELELLNPNSYDITIEELNYKFYINKELVNEGVETFAQVLKGKETSKIQIPFKISLTNAVANLIKKFDSSKTYNYKIEGKAKVSVFGQSLTKNFSHEGNY
ncbi:LEA type 2 family protein [bacterium]|nr:LEA type 2 family protein [bacterium]